MAETRFCRGCGDKIPFDRHDGYCSKKCYLETKESPTYTQETHLVSILNKVAATTSWRPCDLDKILHIVASRVGVISDVHTPLHSGKWLEQAIKTFIHFDIKHVIINGDFLDATQISVKHAGKYHRRHGELGDDLEAADSILKLLSEYFDHIYLDAGNHDMRLLHRFGGELSVQRLWKILGTHPKLQITARSFCKVNGSVAVVHPRQYSKKRGALAQDLSQRHQESVLTGHQHHSAMTISPCGKFQSCDVGCLADVELQDYIRNEYNTFAEPINGFAIILGEKIICFDKFTPWELYGLDDSSLK